MGFKLAELFVSIGTEGEGKVYSALDSIRDSLLHIPVAAQVARTIIGNVTEAIEESEKAFRAAAAGNKLLEATIKSTGGAAGVTSEEIKKMAEEAANTTNFSVGDVVGGAQKLLNFKNVKGDQFKGAMKAILDMTAAGFGDIESNAHRLGLALNDPLHGMMMLRKLTGFTHKDMEHVKSLMEKGDRAGAQSFILSRMPGQGMAQDMANAATISKHKWEAVSEAIGSGLVPILNSMNALTDAFIPKADVIAERAGTIGNKIAGWISAARPTMDAINRGFTSAVGLADSMAVTLEQVLTPAARILGEHISQWSQEFIAGANEVNAWIEQLRGDWPKIWDVMSLDAQIGIEAIKIAGMDMFTEFKAGAAGLSKAFDQMWNEFKIGAIAANMVATDNLQQFKKGSVAIANYYDNMWDSVTIGLLKAAGVRMDGKDNFFKDAIQRIESNRINRAGGALQTIAGIEQGRNKEGIYKNPAAIPIFNELTEMASSFPKLLGKIFSGSPIHNSTAMQDLIKKRNAIVAGNAEKQDAENMVGYFDQSLNGVFKRKGEGKAGGAGEGELADVSGKFEFHSLTDFAKSVQTSLTKKDKDAVIAEGVGKTADELAGFKDKTADANKMLASIDKGIKGLGILGA